MMRYRKMVANARRRVQQAYRLDDVFMTSVVALLGVCDLIIGGIAISDSHYYLRYLSGYEEDELNDAALSITKTQGAAGIQSGIGLTIVASYRIFQWWNSLPFNGQNFVFMFTVGAIGRSVALSTVSWPEGAWSAGFTLLFTRLVLLWFCFGLSLYTYAAYI